MEASEQEGVKLTRGLLTVMSPTPKEPAVTRRRVEGWFLEHARQKYKERLERCLRLFPDPEAVRPAGLMLRELSGRWGSMTPA